MTRSAAKVQTLLSHKTEVSFNLTTKIERMHIFDSENDFVFVFTYLMHGLHNGAPLIEEKGGKKKKNEEKYMCFLH